MTRAILTTVAVALLCAACGNSPTSPTTPTSTARGTETFSGTLAVRGTEFFSFSVVNAGTTDITLLSLRPAGAATPALASEMGLGLGTPAGIGCALSNATRVRPALAAQLSTTTAPTIYCVAISDVGNLSGDVNFTIRIVHP